MSAPPPDHAGFGFIATKHNDTYPFIDPEKGDASGLQVLITGTSKGIGRATAASFARAGVSAIALLARSDLDGVAQEVLEAAKKAGRQLPKILKLNADICDIDAVDKAMKSIEREFGALDIVINNASRLETWHPLAETDPVDWWRTWELNVKGTYLVTRASLPLLLKGKLKTIVTITSAGALTTSPGGSAYQSSKSAQIRLNDFLMKEYGEQGLLAYAVHPGGVKTETAFNMPEWMHHVLTQTAELSADSLVWLTRERKEWLAGRYVNAPWDMEELSAKKDEIVQRDLLKLKLQV